MKTQLTSVDIHILARELNNTLNSSRIDKAYQLGKKELKLKVHVSGEGSLELIIAPGYVCTTQFPREVPRDPSSFAMQLRKNLKGAFIRGVRQHNFDRIVEFLIEKRDEKFTLICEFFSRGNVILCDGCGKIIGLIEWQRWKDRKLGVGQTYDYPPGTKNPLEIDSSSFREILCSSKKKLVVMLATGMGLPGIYAEEVCLISGIDKARVCSELDEREIGTLFDSFEKVTEKIRGGEIKPVVVFDGDKPVDVVSYNLSPYENLKRKEFGSFNEAVDEYFSKEEFAKIQTVMDEKFLGELAKLEVIEEKQGETITRLKKKSGEYHEAGDLIYQNFQVIGKILGAVNEERKKGRSWDDIGKEISGKKIEGIEVDKINKEGSIILKYN